MFHIFRNQFNRKATLAVAAIAVTAGGATAATLHTFSVSSGTGNGSGGATTYVQTGTGSALQGEVAAAPNTGISVPFGVLGEYDKSAGGFGAGVIGVSTTGYGVAGETLNDNPSVLGYSGGIGIGVQGVSNSGNPGVEGYNKSNGTGGIFGSETGSGADIYSSLDAGGESIIGEKSGEGIEARGFSGNAAHPAIAGYDYGSGSDLLGLFGSNSGAGYGTGGDFQENFIVQANTAREAGGELVGGSDVQVSGDIFVYGHVFQDCNEFPATSGTECYEDNLGTFETLSAGTRSVKPQNVQTYGGRQSLPTVEDFGNAQLIGGRAFVRLDPAFAATINPGSSYLVFVTPEGDSRGVFTSNHSMNGFEVHENGGGRSTMTVDYRIVAKPLGDRSQRFAPVREAKLGRRLPAVAVRGRKPAMPTLPRAPFAATGHR